MRPVRRPASGMDGPRMEAEAPVKRPVQPPPARLSKPPKPPAGRSGVRDDGEIDALREATRQAHEVLRDLRTERRAVEQILSGIEERVKRAVADRMEEAVKRDVEALGQVTEKAMRDSVAKVEREFDRLAGILTGREKDSKHGPLEDLIRRHVAPQEVSHD